MSDVYVTAPSPYEVELVRERPVPFVVQVAVAWRRLDAVEERDGLFFAHRAVLSGALIVTENGLDLSIGDLEVDR